MVIAVASIGGLAAWVTRGVRMPHVKRIGEPEAVLRVPGGRNRSGHHAGRRIMLVSIVICARSARARLGADLLRQRYLGLYSL